MNWYLSAVWALVAVYVLASIGAVMSIDKERPPTTHGQAVGMVLTNVVLSLVILVVGGVL